MHQFDLVELCDGGVFRSPSWETCLSLARAVLLVCTYLPTYTTIHRSCSSAVGDTHTWGAARQDPSKMTYTSVEQNPPSRGPRCVVTSTDSPVPVAQSCSVPIRSQVSRKISATKNTLASEWVPSKVFPGTTTTAAGLFTSIISTFPSRFRRCSLKTYCTSHCDKEHGQYTGWIRYRTLLYRNSQRLIQLNPI